MPLKATYQASGFEEIDRWEGGVGWMAHPEETMQRASHALVTDDDEVWLIDPVDAPGIDDLLAAFGTVAGVVVTMDRHRRDSASIANRHDVSVHLPGWVDVAVDAPTRQFRRRLDETPYRAIEVVDVPGWHEAALYDETTGTLVVGEALGTAPYFLTNRERLGVHPMLRLFPPRVLASVSPRRILLGHGAGIFDDAVGSLQDALDNSRRRTPRLLAKTVRSLL